MGTASEMEHGVAAAAGDVTDTLKDAPQAVVEGHGRLPDGCRGDRLRARFPRRQSRSRRPSGRGASTKVADKLEPAKQESMNSAKEVAENLKEPAKQAAQEVKDAASESASAVSSVAREAVDETKQQASESVAAVTGNQTMPASGAGDVQATVAAGGEQIASGEIEGPNSFSPMPFHAGGMGTRRQAALLAPGWT